MVYKRLLEIIKNALEPVSNEIPEGHKKCDECNGQGVFMIEKCQECNGEGIVKMSYQDYVDSLPPEE